MRYTTPGGQVFDLFADALKQPHLLIAGATGSGKSVVINGLIYTALHNLPGCQPGGVEFILIDPKRVELIQWRDCPHSILYASEPGDIVHALQVAMNITETRYREMQRHGQRRFTGGDLYIIIDEYADLITTSKKQVQPIIRRLAQIGRAASVHLVIATQCPLREIIDTTIKVNIDARFGLRTRSAQDSRNILGFAGCENLPRFGQAYYMTPAGTTLYNVPMIDDAALDWMAQYWIRQRPLGFFHRRRK